MPLVETIEIGGAVKFYPYRTARVHDHVMSVPRDQLSELEQKLAYTAGVWRDNHTVYGLTTANGNSLYIFFHDLVVIFGLSIEERAW